MLCTLHMYVCFVHVVYTIDLYILFVQFCNTFVLYICCVHVCVFNILGPSIWSEILYILVVHNESTQ